MRRNFVWPCAFLVLATVVSAAPPVRADSGLPLVSVASVPLPGAPTRFDYESLDADTGLLFIAHLAASEIAVYDVKANRVVTTISGVDQVHGVLAVPELGRVYATATGTNEVAVIDVRTLKIVARVQAGTYPDGMAFDPRDRKLYVSDEHGDTETVIDTTSNRRIATIPLGGDVGNSQYDARSRRVLVNVQTTGELVEIDPSKNAVVARYPVPGCKSNHGLQLDDAHRRAYIACEENATLVVFDLKSHKATQSLPIGDDPDVLAYDRSRSILYVAAESGTVSMLRATAAGLNKIGEGFLGNNAHIVAVDQRTHRVYFPVLSDAGPKLLVMRPRKESRRSAVRGEN
jgi:YVTN family beta-propeller protein